MRAFPKMGKEGIGKEKGSAGTAHALLGGEREHNDIKVTNANGEITWDAGRHRSDRSLCPHLVGIRETRRTCAECVEGTRGLPKF